MSIITKEKQHKLIMQNLLNVKVIDEDGTELPELYFKKVYSTVAVQLDEGDYPVCYVVPLSNNIISNVRSYGEDDMTLGVIVADTYDSRDDSEAIVTKSSAMRRIEEQVVNICMEYGHETSGVVEYEEGINSFNGRFETKLMFGFKL